MRTVRSTLRCHFSLASLLLSALILAASTATPVWAESTTTSGQAYVDACLARGVPTPPDWGSPLWTYSGSIPRDRVFIFNSLDAEVYWYASASPEGVCYALPRLDDAGITQYLGIICQGESGYACFWDNQEEGVSFEVAPGQQVPIVDPAGGLDFAGGVELVNGAGGACTWCHMGENAFVIHPGTALEVPGLDVLPNRWYEPLVSSAWIQNPGPSTLLNGVDPGPMGSSCLDCHISTDAGRLPELSRNTKPYCNTVLGMALSIPTMPPPGFAGDYSAHTNALGLACADNPDGSPLTVWVSSDFAPLSEVDKVWVTYTGYGDATGEIGGRTTLLRPGDDLSPPDGLQVLDAPRLRQGTYLVSVMLLDSSGAALAARGMFVTLPSPASPTAALFLERTARRPRWLGQYQSPWFSEEGIGFGGRGGCPPGFAMSGIECRGDFCDDIRITCRELPGSSGGLAATVGPHTSNGPARPPLRCPEDTVASAARCEGGSGFCGTLLFECTPADWNPARPEGESLLITDDPEGPLEASVFSVAPPEYVSGLKCSGSNCDDKTMLTRFTGGSSVVSTEPGFRLEAPLCLAESGRPGFVALTDCSAGEIFEMLEDGSLRRKNTSQCVGVEPLEGEAIFEPCGQADTWSRDAWGRLRSESFPGLCLGIQAYPRDTQPAPGAQAALEGCDTAATWSLAPVPVTVQRPPPAVFVSEIVEGSGPNQAVEIFNGTDSLLDLSDYELQIFDGSSRSTIPAITVSLSGVVSPGDTFVVVRDVDDPDGNGVDPLLLSLADLRSFDLVFDGNDPIVLYQISEGVPIDAFGQRKVELASFAAGGVETRDRTMVRKFDVCVPDIEPDDAFDPAQDWFELPVDTFDDLRSHETVCVPEPGRLVMLWVGAALLGALRRRTL